MKKIIAILLVAVLAFAAVMPLATAGKKYIDKYSNYMKTWDTEAVIDPNYNGGQGGGDPGAGPITDPNAPEVLYCWILPDEDDQKDCVQIHVNPSDWRLDIFAFMVVTDPEGRDDIFQVFAQVYHPLEVPPWCGSEKFKATQFDPCTDEGCIYDALDAALYSGHLTKAEYDDIVHVLFEKPIAYLYCVQLPMEYCEPCGIYKVKMWAADSDCFSGPYCYALFEWKCGVIVEYDFTSLNFGKIEAGVEKVIIGDEDLSTSDMPTLKNEGNTKVHIQVKSQEMTHTEYDQYKITEFDVYWMGNYFVYNSDGQSGDWTAWCELEPDLCLCQTKQIDFSIHPKHNLPPGTYRGHLTLHISKGDWGEGECPSSEPWNMDMLVP
jgi:hypothetical protein